MEEVLTVLLNRLDTVRKEYKHYRNNPYEPERAHQLRVNIRQLRALFNIIKPNLKLETYDEINQQLRETALIYGPVREIDVLIELCSELALDHPDLSDNYQELFNYLNKERRKEMSRTFNKTNEVLVDETLQMVEDKINHLSDELVEGADQDWPQFITNRIKKRTNNLKEAYEAIDYDDYDKVHEIRKDAKKIRYATKNFSSITTEKMKKVNKKAEEIQDELGKHTDTYVNYQMLEDYSKETEDKELKKLFGELSKLLEKEN